MSVFSPLFPIFLIQLSLRFHSILGFLNISPICRIFERAPVLQIMEDMWAKKVELPDFTGTNPIGWITKAERFCEEQEIHRFGLQQCAFMRMEGEAMCWCKEDLDLVRGIIFHRPAYLIKRLRNQEPERSGVE